ncbi:unnamed protein product [Allacma fusca]|uniref:Uncharacterized protein n=1 Tax=Allacma fusca TaxID=39272 RepID=A0A8J2LVP6_9HEXA|nr:unnamed protein product [Allacma fusca]
MTGNTPKREPTDKIPATPEEFYEALITEAPLKPGDHGISPAKLAITDCDWFQPALIQEGKDFVRRNFYSVMLAHCISLLWVFTFKTGRAVLMRTGNTHVENSRDRYLSTVLHIKLWYESILSRRLPKAHRIFTE